MPDVNQVGDTLHLFRKRAVAAMNKKIITATSVTPQNVITDTKCNSNAKCNNFCHKM